MNKIQEISFERIANHQFSCAAKLQGVASEIYGFQKKVRNFWDHETIKFLPAIIDEDFKPIDFVNNVDQAGQWRAYSHALRYPNTRLLGKVSVRDGNYPPPYQSKTTLIAYNQPVFSDFFSINKISFKINANGTYDVTLVLIRGTGSYIINHDDRIVHDVVFKDDGGREHWGLLLGIEDTEIPDMTLTITGRGLNLTTILAFIIVKYDDTLTPHYNTENNQDYFKKKGVIRIK